MRTGFLKVGTKFSVTTDVLTALWSTGRVREEIALSSGNDYEVVWMWETSWGEEIITISCPRLSKGQTLSLITGTHWDWTPARYCMGPRPFMVGDQVVEIRTGKKRKIAHVFVHRGYGEHHYSFEGESPNSNLRWHHELKVEEESK